MVKERELAVHAALGASRGRQIRLLLSESMTLTVIAGLLGIGIGQVISHGLSAIPLQIDIPLHLDFSFDWRVFVYCMGIAILTGAIVGIVPAVRASRGDLRSLLHSGDGRTSSGVRYHRFRNALIVGQVMGSLILLLVAGLLMRSLANAQHVSLGFSADHVTNFSVDPQEVGYSEAAGDTFYRELKARAGALPGVQSVSLALSVPFGYYFRASKVYLEGADVQQQQRPQQVLNNVVDTDYFSTMQIPIMRGRLFLETDNQAAPHVAVVNQSFAAHFWPNQDPMGKRFSTESASGPFVQVIGIAKDSKYLTPADEGRPYFYLSLAQHYFSQRTLQVRAVAPAETIISEVRQQIHDLEPNLPVFDVHTMNEALNGANGFFLFRLGAMVATGLGFLGMVLAMVGVYSIIAYSVVQRTREIGIRLALGAQPVDITKLLLRQGLYLLAFGLAGGLVLGLLVTRGMSHILLGIGAADPLTLGAVCVLLSAVVLLACYIPARRAAKVDPLVALRYE
jgi:predicted permease